MRLTVLEQVSRNANNLRRGLAVRVIDPSTGYIVKAAKLFEAPTELRQLIPLSNIEVRTPLGLLMDPSVLLGRCPVDIDAKAAEMDALFEVANPRKSKIEIPEVIDDPRLPFRVMKGVATGGQLAGLVKAGYEIAGYGADNLKDAIADESNAAKGVGYAALLEGRALAKELNRQNPGRKFRVPTEEELLKLNELVGNQLSGTEFWIWTETKYNDVTFVLRLLDDGFRSRNFPGSRDSVYAVRLVEDR